MRTLLVACCCLLLAPLANAAFLSQHRRGARGVVSDGYQGTGLSRLITSSESSSTSLSAIKKTTKKKAAKKKAAKKKTEKAPVENFKRAEFVAELAERTAFTKKDADMALDCVLGIIKDEVGDGKRISFPGFGTFTLKDRAERMGRNPQTGEELVIPASKSPSFSASKTWKDNINGK